MGRHEAARTSGSDDATRCGMRAPGSTPGRPTTPTTWTLEFAGYPPSANARLHWRTRAKVAKFWRGAALLEAKRLGIPPCERIRISAVVIRRALGVADEDNDRGRLKPVQDGIRDAGVIPNDRRECVELGPVTEERGPKGLRVIVERLA